MAFEFYSASCNTSGPLALSSHELRYKPFLGSVSSKTQKMRQHMGRSMESGKYEWEWHDDPSRRPPNSYPFPEGDQLTRIPSQRPR
jgi:hypothetical protein